MGPRILVFWVSPTLATSLAVRMGAARGGGELDVTACGGRSCVNSPSFAPLLLTHEQSTY